MSSSRWRTALSSGFISRCFTIVCITNPSRTRLSAEFLNCSGSTGVSAGRPCCCIWARAAITARSVSSRIKASGTSKSFPRRRASITASWVSLRIFCENSFSRFSRIWLRNAWSVPSSTPKLFMKSSSISGSFGFATSRTSTLNFAGCPASSSFG